jgi:hypothetical protein
MQRRAAPVIASGLHRARRGRADSCGLAGNIIVPVFLMHLAEERNLQKDVQIDFIISR